MHKLKSSYIFFYTLLILGLSFYSAYQILWQKNFLWIGVFLTGFPVLCLSILRRFGNSTAFDERESIVTALSLIGLAIVLIGDSDRGDPLLFSFVGLVGLLVYIYWGSSLSPRSAIKLKKGDQLPVLFLNCGDGSVELSVDRPTVILWLHGLWCPFSVMQLRQLVDVLPGIQSLGVQVIAITSDNQEAIDRALPRDSFESGAKSATVSRFTLLQDKDAAEASQHGLALRGGVPLGLSIWGFGRDALVPTLMLIDARGKIVALEQASNYRLPPFLPELAQRIQMLLA